MRNGPLRPKVLTLARILLKDVGSAFEIRLGGKERKWAGVLLWSLLIVGMLPMAYILYDFFRNLYAQFAPLGQLAFATGTVFNLACVAIFFLSALSAPAIFYFSREVEFLLPLPLKPTEIIGAKFLVSLLFEYIIALFILAPMCVAYMPHLPPGPFAVNMLLTLLTLPIAPLAYSTAAVMLLMRLSRFGRNRDVYNMLVGLLSVGVGIGFGAYSSRLNAISPEQAEALITGNQGVLLTLRSLFPNNTFASLAVAGGGAAAQLANIAITAVILVLFFLLAKLLYFKGVIGISESSAPSKKTTGESIKKEAKSRNVFYSLLGKELKLLFRSPTALLNCVLVAVLMPVAAAVSLAVYMNSPEMPIAISVDFSNPGTLAMIMTGAAASGFLLSAMNMVTSTSISREGRNYFVMKYIPVEYGAQINAKAASGVVVSVMGLAPLLIALEVIFKAPPMIFLGAALLTLPGVITLNYLGLLVDLFKPKLAWDNETYAVKQNINAVIMMMAGIILTVVVMGIGMSLFKTPGLAFTVWMAAGLALCAASCVALSKLGEKMMVNLNA